MQISSRKQSCFEITIRNEEKEAVALNVDFSNKTCNLKVSGEGDSFLIDGPGEYELKGALIKALDSSQNDIIYKIRAEGMSVCVFGNFEQKELSDEQVEELGGIDIIIMSIGDKGISSIKSASSIISQIEPRMVATICPDQSDEFLKLMGKEKTEPEKKLKVSPRDLPKEETEIVILES